MPSPHQQNVTTSHSNSAQKPAIMNLLDTISSQLKHLMKQQNRESLLIEISTVLMQNLSRSMLQELLLNPSERDLTLNPMDMESNYDMIRKKHLEFLNQCIVLAEKSRLVSPKQASRSPMGRQNSFHSSSASHLSPPSQPETLTTPQQHSLLKSFIQWAAEIAIHFDARSKYAEAVEIYTLCVEMGMEVVKCKENTTVNTEMRGILSSILSRAEACKKLHARQQKTRETSSHHRRNASPANNIFPSRALTELEKEILKKSSRINNRVFKPFVYSLDVEQRILKPSLSPNSPKLTDKIDTLPLSDTQKKYFYAWKRPRNFLLTEPQMFSTISPLTIRQDVVSDCSFIASLCVAANYEERFRTPLVTNIIYPQNSKGEPIYNPQGEYCVKLYANGCARSVHIDDHLPVDSSNRPLCAHSLHKDLWVPLIEKAFLKLNGGYTFPGSNSGIDMYALTGWIPEDVHIKSQHTPFNRDQWWQRLYDGFCTGASVVTVSTGSREELLAPVGLDTKHAYAVLKFLEVRESSTSSKVHRMVLIKNPWCKGTFTPSLEEEATFLTPRLLEELNYYATKKIYKKHGVFWIDYESMLKYFDTLHISWQPSRFGFKHQQVVHGQWLKQYHPHFFKSDKHNYSYNPQYHLVTEASSKGSIWIVLTRHCTDISKVHNKFITLHIFADVNDDARGSGGIQYIKSRTIDTKIKEGTYVNNSHLRLCLNVGDEGQSSRKYILVVSQLKEIQTIEFSISSYGSIPHDIRQLPTRQNVPEKRVATLCGEWNDKLAGGSWMNPASYKRNPQIALQILKPCRIVLTLEASKDYLLCITIFKREGLLQEAATKDNVLAYTPYRKRFTFSDTLHFDSPGSYCLIVNTHNPTEKCDYVLTALTNRDDSVRLRFMSRG